MIAEIRSLMALLIPPDPTEEVAQPAMMASKSNRRRSAPGWESAAAQAGPRETAALGVGGLPAEEIGPAAALQDPPNSYRDGPELSWLLMQGRRDLRPDGVLVRTTPDDQRVPSRDLDNAASNPGVRDAVGLGGAETEAGTGVGTEVEGGWR